MKRRVNSSDHDIRNTYSSPTHNVNLENALYSDKKCFNTKRYEDLLKPLKIQQENLKIIAELGQGAFGIVYKGIFTQSGCAVEVAVKALKENSSSEDMEDFLSESVTMMEFDHPNVIKLLGICFDADHGLPLIVLPYMVNRDLKSFLVSSRKDNSVEQFPETLDLHKLKAICHDIAKGMEYLSELKFVHRDLAARNCMVNECLSIKVADFGFTRDVYGQEYYRMKRRTILPVKWLPPESLFDNVYDEKTDVWSYGVTCWEVYSLGRTPYPGLDNRDIPEYVGCGNRLQRPFLCSHRMYLVMMHCWVAKPEDRPTFKELIGTIESIDDEDVTEKSSYFVLEDPCQHTETTEM